MQVTRKKLVKGNTGPAPWSRREGIPPPSHLSSRVFTVVSLCLNIPAMDLANPWCYVNKNELNSSAGPSFPPFYYWRMRESICMKNYKWYDFELSCICILLSSLKVFLHLYYALLAVKINVIFSKNSVCFFLYVLDINWVINRNQR